MKTVPTALKVVRGNPGRRPLPAGEYHPPVEIPPCPKHLKGEARKEWGRVTKLLEAGGLISQLDRGMLSMLCLSWGRHVEAELAMQEHAAAHESLEPMVVKPPTGTLMQSPYMAISNKAMELYIKLSAEFGLTPCARSKVTASEIRPYKGKAAPKGEEPDNWNQFE